jgi:HSP20 family molecular chaperone IbpA
MVAFRTKLEPDVCTYVDEEENSFRVEVVLPGVSKADIKLKVNSHCMVVFARAVDVDYSKYIPFRYPVMPDRAKAIYEHDLLIIKVPLRG